uniref:Uncharacterized protein n=1 Tax=Astyanax mexicanus TaxID=7994 RepID=A0A3B1JDG6_ASTMX
MQLLFQIVRDALCSKASGKEILEEYKKTSTISDVTRRKMVNILVADMVEYHGRVPPVNVRNLYALGITTLFPKLSDPDSKNGYIDQDFSMIFGEEVSGKFLSKWPTFFKPRVIADCCKNLTPSPVVDELLLSAQQESDDGGKC